MSNGTALIILDAQINMFDPAEPIHGAQHILETLQFLLKKARLSNFLIIYIQNNGKEGDPDQPQTTGWLIHPAILPKRGDLIFQKTSPDAFGGTILHQELQSRGIERLIIAGMQSELCIKATCLKAAEYGYDVTLVADAHSTFASEDISAEQMIAQTNRELSSIVRIGLSGELLG